MIGKASGMYAITFLEDLPDGAAPLPFSVFGHSLVLWRDAGGTLRCVRDRCPHRAAKLSEGRVRAGNLECSYHGWTFEGARGSCTKIPQLDLQATIPAAACVQPFEVAVREGIVFVNLLGKDETAPGPSPAPCSPDDLDIPRRGKAKFAMNNFQIDLPYDYSFLIENLIDPAHIPISHDATPGGGKRENAQALEMQVDASSVGVSGFTGRYRATRLGAKTGKPDPWTETAFEAPGIVRYRSQRGNIVFGGALHCVPLAPGRSRLLFRVYFSGLPWIAMLVYSLKPQWLRNLNSCKVLEQDVGLICTQEDHLSGADGSSAEGGSSKGVGGGNRGGASGGLAGQYLTLASQDTFVKAYRVWQDRFRVGMPWAVGWSSPAADVAAASPLAASASLGPGLDGAHRALRANRFERHGQHCRATRNALQGVKRLALAAQAAGMVAALAAAALKAARPAALGAVFCFAASFGLRKLEAEFYTGFRRQRDELPFASPLAP
ncbi:unnamed protein product [Polarella glacialis]|uniref:Rieske domain-containing protein n=1 Tax=Polarella glacialis TaxID=89957 RepID=A0A813H4Z8_POLGL|nr:unnamed protein product [Polarella glacialis]CAE8732698.1 unnamed protein product [Polarella glacialis]